MVVRYLEKIKDRFQNDLMNLKSSLNELLSRQKENTEIIKILEVKDDSCFEAFTPHPVNSFNKKKIAELKEEQSSLEKQILDLKQKVDYLEKELSEVNEVIKVAKECIF